MPRRLTRRLSLRCRFLLLTRQVLVCCVSACVVLACVVLACVVSPSEARAACPSSSRPYVLLETQVKPPDQIIAEMLEQHLRVSLRSRQIELCHESSSDVMPVGKVLLKITREPSGRVIALVRVGDNVTDKRVERTMDLSEVPEDARPSAVASSGDELLRASWAELLIADAPKPRMEPPDAVLSSVEESVVDGALRRRVQLGLLSRAEVFQDLTAVAGDLRLGYWVTRRWNLALQGQVDIGLSQSTPGGSVRLVKQGGGVLGGYSLFPQGHAFNVIFEGGVRASQVELIPSATENFIESRVSDWTLEATAGSRAAWAWSSRIELSLGLGAVFSPRPVAAVVNEQTIVSNEGLGASLSFGLLGLF